MDLSKHIQDSKWIITNVIVTFVQGSLAAWALVGNKTDQEALVGAAAAGLSAVWNLVLKPFAKSKGWL